MEGFAELKGRSCSHIRRLDPTSREQIEIAPRTGYEVYERRGWA